MAAPLENEQLLTARIGSFRVAVPMKDVARVLQAALPVVVPGAQVPHCLRVGDQLVPLVFGPALFGATEAKLNLEDKVLLLGEGAERLSLWVSAVEEVVPFVAWKGEQPAAAASPWVSAVSAGEQTLPVLDTAALRLRAAEFGARTELLEL